MLQISALISTCRHYFNWWRRHIRVGATKAQDSCHLARLEPAQIEKSLHPGHAFVLLYAVKLTKLQYIELLILLYISS
jgi:hypothetical protein